MTQVSRLSLLDRATHAEYVAFFVLLSEMLPYCALHPVKLPLPLCVVCFLPGLHPLECISWRKEVRDRNTVSTTAPLGQDDGSCLQVVWDKRRGPSPLC